MKVVANYFTCLNKVTDIYLLGIMQCFFECMYQNCNEIKFHQSSSAIIPAFQLKIKGTNTPHAAKSMFHSLLISAHNRIPCN